MFSLTLTPEQLDLLAAGMRALGAQIAGTGAEIQRQIEAQQRAQAQQPATGGVAPASTGGN